MTAIQPRNRFWLYAPYAVVMMIFIGWSALWFMIKGRVATGIDQWTSRENEAGRDWRCEDRSIAGFPFRFEVKCANLSLKRPSDPSAPAINAGPVLVVAQVYDPNHLIAEPKGPLVASWSDGRKASMVWDAGQISLRRSSSQFERGSLTLNKLVLSLTGFDASDGTARTSRLEAHLRPTPGRAAEFAMDVAISFDKLVMPALDQLLSSAQPADLKIETTISQSASLAGGITPTTVETWRLAGGVVDLSKLSLVKGTAQLEGQGKFSFDEFRRVKGRLDGAQTGIDTVGGMRIGAMLDAGALLAGRAASQTQNGKSLKPLPPLEARDGRLYLGPLRIPGTPLRPLY